MVMVDEVNVIQKRWLRGKRQTLEFWRIKVARDYDTFNKEFPLHQYFQPMIGDKKEVSILDIGSGALSTTGSTWEGVKIDLHPSDILADEFAQIFEEQNLTPLFPIEKQDMEHLTYKDSSFDIVHSVN